jgi:sterol desaturase/sphingolipid hydroxylase (fatty acid hydroxylase superfamily)
MGVLLLLRTASFLTGFVALLLGERLIPCAPSEQRKSFRVLFHLGISLANSVLLYLVMSRLTMAVLALTGGRQMGLAHLLGLTGWGEIVATVVAFDFWDYWMHRANHRLPFLWRFHKAHHSDMEIDVTTSARFHPCELIISNGVKCLVILLWGPSLAGLVAFDTLLTACSQFHHSNLDLPNGLQDPLERLLVTPRMHRCHHALHKKCWNTNFATIMSAWDRIGRSYHLARDRREMAQIGLLAPRGTVTMQLVPFLLTPVKDEAD